VESSSATDGELATLAFRFHDEHGEVLYEHRKSARAATR
jgi:hypothetical protein